MASVKKGRPRIAKKWGSVMCHDLVVDFKTDKDVHTTLYLEGAGALDLVMVALREYIVRHRHPGGDPAVQAQVAMEGLGLDGAAPPARPAPAPAAAALAPVPVAVQSVALGVDADEDSQAALLAFARLQMEDS